MENADRWDVALDQAIEPLPRHPLTLTPPPKGIQPGAIHLPTQGGEAMAVSRDGVVVQGSLQHSPQPRAKHRDRFMAPAQQGLSYRFQGGAHALGRGQSFDGEMPAPQSRRTDVREAEEVEHFWPAAAGPRAAFGRIPAKLQHSRLRVVQRQPKLRESHPQRLRKPKVSASCSKPTTLSSA